MTTLVSLEWLKLETRSKLHDLVGIFGTPLVPPGSAETRDLKFCVHIDSCGPKPNLCKSFILGVWRSVTWPTFNFCDPLHISGVAKARQSCTCSVCGAFDAAFTKLLWPHFSFFYVCVYIFLSSTLYIVLASILQWIKVHIILLLIIVNDHRLMLSNVAGKQNKNMQQYQSSNNILTRSFSAQSASSNFLPWRHHNKTTHFILWLCRSKGFIANNNAILNWHMCKMSINKLQYSANTYSSVNQKVCQFFWKKIVKYIFFHY